MNKDFYPAILNYTIRDNEELRKEFLERFKKQYPSAKQINEFVYALNDININEICRNVKIIYDKCIKDLSVAYNNDYISVLSSGKLVNDPEIPHQDRIVEFHICGSTYSNI